MVVLFSHFTASSSPTLLSPDPDSAGQIRSNLYIVSPDGVAVLADGNLTQYSTTFSNDLDGMDARKMSNSSENWGMLRNKTVYVIERRHTIESTDSIFIKMWNMRIITYRIKFITSNLNTPGRIGVLEDKFLKTATPFDLNGNTDIDFSVTSDPASAASDRFRIIFKNKTTQLPPFAFISEKASEKNNLVNIDWQTANENNIKQFNIESSADGFNYNKLNSITPGKVGSNNYHWVAAFPTSGNNYYRISNVGLDGKLQYSDVMQVNSGKGIQKISIYPNPASVKNFNLQMINQQAGLYEIKLMNFYGQIFFRKLIQYPGGSSIINMQLSQNIPKGIYQLEIRTTGRMSKVLNVVFLDGK